MNISLLVRSLGQLLIFMAGFLLLPVLIGLIYHEMDMVYFIMVAAGALVCGLIFRGINTKGRKLRAKEGLAISALSWIMLSFVVALPFYLSGAITSYTDAVFETASGFTTTGATILADVEKMSHCMLFWRSFTHWLGGMGILVFILAVLPSDAQNMKLMKAESPGPTVDKLVPKVKETARHLYIIYTAFTVAMILILILGGMEVFDSICITFGTAGTGGFGVKNDSIAGYNTFCQVVITVFMLLFGVNFKFYFLLMTKKFKDIKKLEEVKWYFIIYLTAVIIIIPSILGDAGGVVNSIKEATFQAASIMTTTGYSTVDFNLWHTLPKVILIFLMFVGACAGSTGGGLKVSRIVIYAKQLKRQIGRFNHPLSVKKIKQDGGYLDDNTLNIANVYIMAYVGVVALSVIIIAIDGFDFETTFTAVAATINNIGPGLGKVGPTGNFADFSVLSKWVMIFDMIAGRLELYPLLLLFAPSSWTRQ